jgi:hypothetical protein
VLNVLKDFPEPRMDSVGGIFTLSWPVKGKHFSLSIRETSIDYYYEDSCWREEYGTTHLDDLPKLLRSYGI